MESMRSVLGMGNKSEAKPDRSKDKEPSFIVTIKGPVKGHRPVEVTVYGKGKKEALNAFKALVAHGIPSIREA